MTTRHFFVDEAGDLTLFDKRGRPMLGRDGVSSYFMVGVAEIPAPDLISATLQSLRLQMIADPYFNGAASFDPERRRTAVVFHAKDDLPEVRWRVYEQLRGCPVRFAVVIRRKSVLEDLAIRAVADQGKKLCLDEIYDDLVTQLFAGRFNHACEHHITFAVRRTANRDAALMHAIDRARLMQQCHARCSAISDRPSEVLGLQVVDYYLWATQRAFERREGRFLAGMADQIEYVWDLDDVRGGDHGIRYEGKKTLLGLNSALPLAPARFEANLEHPT